MDYKGIERVLWVTMGLNFIPAAAKLAAGLATGSLSLVADGFDSVFDGLSNVVGLVGVSLASRPADEEHPYGHSKAETITALAIAGMLFLTMYELIKSAVARLSNPSLIQAEVNVWSFVALFISIGMHLAVSQYEVTQGRRLSSDVLVADAMHTRADILVSVAVMGGLIAVALGAPIADPILALLVALFIGKIGLNILRENVPTLMDQVAYPRADIEAVAEQVPGVISVHKVRSRGHQGATYIDLHIQSDPSQSLERAHALSGEVKARIGEAFPGVEDVVVHVEPARDDDRSGPPPDAPRNG